MELVLFKTTAAKGRQRTLRWPNGKLTDIETIGTAVNIQVAEGHVAPVTLGVAEFEPIDGDVLTRDWFADGVRHTLAVKCFAIKDISVATKAYKQNIREASGDIRFFERALNTGDRYLEIFETAIEISTRSEGDLVQKALELWAACWFNSTSTYIVEENGENPLGQLPYDETYQDPGKVPISPVMSHQINLIIIEHESKLLQDIMGGFDTNQPINKTFDILYVFTFVLLQIAYLSIKRDEKYARKHEVETQFARPQMIPKYINTATVICDHLRPFAEIQATPNITDRMETINKVYAEIIAAGEAPFSTDGGENGAGVETADKVVSGKVVKYEVPDEDYVEEGEGLCVSIFA